MSKIKQFVLAHKIITVLVILVLVYGGYKWHASATSGVKTSYALATVQKGTLVVSVSGSGQVSASDQVDIKPKTSGTLTYVGIKAGQDVRSGQVIAYIDATDAQKAVRDAEINLQSAQTSLEKLKQSQQSGDISSQDTLSQSYKDAYAKISDAFLNLPNIMDTARAVLYDNGIPKADCTPNTCEFANLVSQDSRREFQSIISQAENDYNTAKNAYDPNFDAYRNLRVDASTDDIRNILDQTEKTSELVAQALKSDQNMLNFVVSDMKNEASKINKTTNIPSQITTYQNNISSAISQTTSIGSGLLSTEHTIDSTNRSIDNNQVTNPLDLQSQQNTVTQRESVLQDAKDALADYTVRAPFAGKIAKLDVSKGDTVSSGTALATILTKQSVAEISLNEVDVANIKLGQKATLTFDAVPDLSITGRVDEIDSLGTVSQGVVNYTVKIGFDLQDDRIKPGMSVSAAIVTDLKQDVLLVPSSAVKSAGGNSYVEMPADQARATQLMANATSAGISLPSLPTQKMVQVGESSDSETEITSGLNEGDLIVVRTISSSTSTTANATQNRSLLQSIGGNRGSNTGAGGGGGGNRVFIQSGTGR